MTHRALRKLRAGAPGRLKVSKVRFSFFTVLTKVCIFTIKILKKNTFNNDPRQSDFRSLQDLLSICSLLFGFCKSVQYTKCNDNCSVSFGLAVSIRKMNHICHVWKKNVHVLY